MTRPAVHANCVLLGTVGLLIRGDAGSGKSSLSDELIHAAGCRGNLGLLVGDDYVHVENRYGRLLAKVPDAIRGRMEVRGFGVVATAFTPVADICVVVDLTAPDRLERLPDTPLDEVCLEGVQVPRLHCPDNDTGGALRLIRWALRCLRPEGPDYI